MHHLFLTRKAAASITAAMRYFIAKKKFGRMQKGSELVKEEFKEGMRMTQANSYIQEQQKVQGNEDELMIIEKVEEQDLREMKNMMDNRLVEFRDEWNELK